MRAVWPVPCTLLTLLQAFRDGAPDLEGPGGVN